MKQPLKILFVSPEISPYGSTGGLSEVAEALPQALLQKGVQIYRVMPKYAGIENRFPLKKRIHFLVEIGGKPKEVVIYSHKMDGIITLFVSNKEYFDRFTYYGFEDDHVRYGFFCKAVLEMLLILNLKPDILHLNDWQSALISLYLKEEYSNMESFANIKTIYTIHNLQYQGVFPIHALHDLGLSFKYYTHDSLEYHSDIAMMKAGLIYSDMVTTVSNTYATEIQTSLLGHGLDGVLRKYEHKLVGIQNGMKYDKYNPETDEIIAMNYTIDTYQVGKAANKKDLEKYFGDSHVDGPAFGMVSRFTEQKGLDILSYAIEKLCRNEDAKFYLLGTGDAFYEKKLLELALRFPDKVFVKVGYDNDLAKKIFAGTDFYLMPSQFEPCGLGQLYSMRYGSIPVVRKTGGLTDTVFPIQLDATGTGIVFEEYSEAACHKALEQAVRLYSNKEFLDKIIINCLNQRFTWDKSADKYIENYYNVLI